MLKRRELLISLLAAGSVGVLPGCVTRANPAVMRAMPEPAEMPDYMSVFEYTGTVTINGRPLTLESRIGSGDVIETGPDSQLAFVCHEDAWQLDPGTQIRMPMNMDGGSYTIDRGAALGVFASRQVYVSTPDAVIGIRGTGIYVEVETTRSYICTCYGETEISAKADPSVSEVIVSKHHDAPRYVSREPGQLITPAPFKNHEDKELSMIETLVGREMPEH